MRLPSLVVAGLVAVACSDAKPAVERCEPDFGSPQGGDEVLVRGHGFTQGVAVRFGRRPAQIVTVESEAKLRVRAPGGEEGPVDLTVEFPDGRNLVLSRAFRYQRPKQLSTGGTAP